MPSAAASPSGGTANGTTISSGGTLELLGGATASGTMISSGGALEIGSGFTISGYVVSSGISLEVASGGTASGVSVSSGGAVDVFAGGTASGATINNGGHAFVFSGGKVDAATISAGTLVLSNGAIVSGTISFSGGGTLLIEGTGSYGLVAGFAVPDTFDLAAVNFASASASFNSATDVLTVTDGAHSVSIELIGNYAAGNFNLKPESGGTGTLVVDPPIGGTISSVIG